ncbi:MAG TPA: hypothetical protein PLD33_02025 [Anaerolineales bacterium]|nr:hypothetical protein [Anaerolineales bacterium]HNB85940.1 hypothetical protein [Anaerolineales bacterium]HND90217.1 hypothetical protein [Anaerolineales bacterium]HNF34752.1 hypothetical protein [Anaerolineales bacterium]HNH77396.1 hypothetical protein [Anaerolineales bacterium]
MKRIHPSLTLLAAAVLAYGLLIPQLGFYWDDLPMSWIRYQLGFEAMTKYFSTNRPIWALLYQVTTRILPHLPIYWQVFALFWRWLGAVVLWNLAKELFPQREKFALTLGLLFLLYPGFNQQWVSYLYSHFFLVLFFFLFSQLLMLRGKTIPALVFSALNLWMMEYFFVLELIRPFIIWTSLRDEVDPKERIKRTLNLWTPYLAVFALAVLSRIFIFNNQIYQFSLKDELVKAPLATVLMLAQNVLSSFFVVTVAAWGQAFQFPNPLLDGPRTIAVYAFVLLAVAALTLFGLWNQVSVKEGSGSTSVWRWALLLGAVMLVLAGPPFWLTNVPVSLGFPANRATLSFMLGVSFVLAGLFDLLPQKFYGTVVVLFVMLAAGRQFLWSNEFRRDWASHKNMFWQMTWRAPGLEKDTIVLMNEELSFYADNSLGAALNLIYAPENHSDAIDYVLFYPTNRESLSLSLDTPVNYDFLAGQFSGNTSQTVVFYYAPPKCLRLLDPEIDLENRLIPDDTFLRDAALLSSTSPILSRQTSRMPAAYGNEPVHGWCYYFEKADLARQMGDWETVTQLGDVAFALDDYPNDPVERFVFIEGYAHTGNWERAVELSTASYKVSKAYVGPLLCRLWSRIARETEDTSERKVTFDVVQSELECSP